jgi:hypothetical protein
MINVINVINVIIFTHLELYKASQVHLKLLLNSINKIYIF